MGNDNSFRIKPGFQFEQGIGAPALVKRIGTMQHQAFATGLHDLRQNLLQFGGTGHLVLPHRLHPGGANASGQRFDTPHPLGKIARRPGQLEHHVAHRAPIAVNGSLAPDNAGKALELSASQPQLAIQRDIRGQGLGEPGRCGNRIAVARDQLLAVPDSTHTIIFLTDQVATDIDTLTIDIGQQDIRRRGAEQQ